MMVLSQCLGSAMIGMSRNYGAFRGSYVHCQQITYTKCIKREDKSGVVNR